MQSRRSFLGLISAISAAVASGVRLPDAPEAKAAEVAPVEVPRFNPGATSWDGRHGCATPAARMALEQTIREAIKDCVVVRHVVEGSAGEIIRHRVTYKRAPNAKCVFVDRPFWEKGHMISATVTETVEPALDLSDRHTSARRWKVDPLASEREIEITWIV